METPTQSSFEDTTRLERQSVAARQAPTKLQHPGKPVDIAPRANGGLTQRGRVVKFGAKVALTASIIGGAGYGIHEARKHNTITIPTESQEHNVFNVGSIVTVGSGAKAHTVKPTNLSTISELAYPDKDYRDLESALHDEVVAYNKANHYTGDPGTLQEGTPLILPPDAHIGYHVDAVAPAN